MHTLPLLLLPCFISVDWRPLRSRCCTWPALHPAALQPQPGKCLSLSLGREGTPSPRMPPQLRHAAGKPSGHDANHFTASPLPMFLEQSHECLEPRGHLDLAHAGPCSPERGNAPAWLPAQRYVKGSISQSSCSLVFKSRRTISIMTSCTVEIQLLQGSISLGWIFSAAATRGELAC